MIVATYREGATLPPDPPTQRHRKRRLSKFRVRDLAQATDENQSPAQRRMKRLLEQMKREVGCLIVFFGASLAFVADRVYFFGFLNEAAGWRQVTEVGLLMSRFLSRKCFNTNPRDKF